MIALSCDVKISAVHHLVLSQSTRVTDRRTDRITTPKTALAYARAVKSRSRDLGPAPFDLLLHFLLTGLAVNVRTKSEVSSFTHSRDIKRVPKL